MDVRASLELILSDEKHEFSRRFYQNLFLHHPEISSKFDGVDIKHQGSMLIMALKVAIDYRSRPYPAVQSYLRVLGHKHHLRGILSSDYLLFETTLLTTLGAFHGNAWNPELASNWKKAFQQATQLMAEGHVDDFCAD